MNSRIDQSPDRKLSNKLSDDDLFIVGLIDQRNDSTVIIEHQEFTLNPKIGVINNRHANDIC